MPRPTLRSAALPCLILLTTAVGCYHQPASSLQLAQALGKASKPEASRPVKLTGKAQTIAASLKRESLATLAGERIKLRQPDDEALERAIASATQRVFADNSGSPDSITLDRLSEQVRRLTETIVALNRYEVVTADAQSLSAFLYQQHLEAWNDKYVEATKGDDVPKKGFGLGKLTSPAASTIPPVQCLKVTDWRSLLDRISGVVGALPAKTTVRLRLWAAAVNDKAQKIPDTEMVCVSGEQVRSLQLILLEINNPKLTDLLRIAEPNAGDEAPTKDKVQQAPALRSAKALPAAPESQLQPTAPSSPAPTKPAPEGLVARTLKLLCPAYPFC